MEILKRIHRRLSWPLIVIWIAYSLYGPVSALIIGSVAPLLSAVGVSLFIFFCGLYFVYSGSKFSRILFYLSFSASTYLFYVGSGITIEELGLDRMDSAIAGIDRFLLGWALPEGQLTLWLNQDGWAREFIGPSSTFGRVLIEYFQSLYFSYYIWGNILFIFLMWMAVRKNKFKEAEFYVVSWFFAYIVTFVFYPIIPVAGPMVYYHDLYREPIEGFGLAKYINQWILAQQETKEDCFPSGHTAISWIVALSGLRLWPRFGKWALIAAVSITISTVFLRYHYVTDLIAAVPLVLGSMALGRIAYRDSKA